MPSTLATQAEQHLANAKARQSAFRDRALKLLSSPSIGSSTTGERLNAANQLWYAPQSLHQDYDTHLIDPIYQDGSVNHVIPPTLASDHGAMVSFGESYREGLEHLHNADKGLGISGEDFGTAWYNALALLEGNPDEAERGRRQMDQIQWSSSRTRSYLWRPEFQAALAKTGIKTVETELTSTKDMRDDLLRMLHRESLEKTLDPTDDRVRRVARVVDQITAASRTVMALDNESLLETLLQANRGAIETTKAITVPEILTQQLVSCAMADEVASGVSEVASSTAFVQNRDLARAGAASLLERVEQLTDAWTADPTNGQALFKLSLFFEAMSKRDGVRKELWAGDHGVVSESIRCPGVDELPSDLAAKVDAWSRDWGSRMTKEM